MNTKTSTPAQIIAGRSANYAPMVAAAATQIVTDTLDHIDQLMILDDTPRAVVRAAELHREYEIHIAQKRTLRDAVRAMDADAEARNLDGDEWDRCEAVMIALDKQADIHELAAQIFSALHTAATPSE